MKQESGGISRSTTPVVEVIELLVEGAARKVGQPALAHWRSLFAELGNDNNEYDQEAYLAAVGAVTSDFDLVEFIRRWVEQGLPSNEALYQQLVESGIQLGGLRDDNVGRAQFAALMHVFSLDCPNGFSLSHRPAGVQVRGNGSCVLLPDQWLDVESIAGVPVTGSGAALVETIARACEHFDPLSVVGSLKEDHELGSEELPNRVQVEIPMGCHKPFRFVELTGWAQ